MSRIPTPRSSTRASCAANSKLVPSIEFSKWPTFGMEVLDQKCFNAAKAGYRVVEKRPHLRAPTEQARRNDLRISSMRSRSRQSLQQATEAFHRASALER